MATITFYGNGLDNDQQALLDHNAGSGIGFFGDGWGFPVPVGSVQDTTWVTDQDGADEGPQLNNNAFITEGDNVTPGTVSIDQSTPVALNRLPNYKSTLNIRFNHETAVIASQPKIIIYDRANIQNHAVNVITYVYECRHPLADQQSSSGGITMTNLNHRASTANTWTMFEDDAGSPEPMSLTNSPGPNGWNTTVSDTAAGPFRTFLINQGESPDDYNKGSTGAFVQHDWYVALSSSPTEIGQKREYGLYFTVDYL